MTKFLNEHPGGAPSIMVFAGKDATSAFKMIHAESILEQYGAEYVIGEVATGGAAPAQSSTHATTPSGPGPKYS